MNINILYHNKKYISFDDKLLASQEIIDFINKKITNPRIKEVEVNIHFIHKDKIHTLNSSHRHIDKPTDVLSFPIYNSLQQINNTQEPYITLGDIFICPSIAQKQMPKNSNIVTEINMLTLHGLKHLVGIHHK